MEINEAICRLRLNLLPLPLHRPDLAKWLFSLQDEEEESDLDDETMFKFDDALAAVMKARKGAKQDAKEKERQMVIYKNK